ncbi:MAG: hypothetical protein ACK559_18860, partial [bacterium]
MGDRLAPQPAGGDQAGGQQRCGRLAPGTGPAGTGHFQFAPQSCGLEFEFANPRRGRAGGIVGSSRAGPSAQTLDPVGDSIEQHQP